MRYKPTRAATNIVAGENEDGRPDGDGTEGAGDAAGPEDDAGDISGDGEGDGEADNAAPAAGAGAARTGLGESMAAFFQRGATMLRVSRG